MRQLLILAVSILCLSAALAQQPASKPVKTINITDTADIALAASLAKAIDAMPGPMAACMKDGGKSEACLCKQKDRLIAVDTALADIRAKRQAWLTEDTVVAWQSNGMTNTIVLPAIGQQQAAFKVQCGS